MLITAIHAKVAIAITNIYNISSSLDLKEVIPRTVASLLGPNIIGIAIGTKAGSESLSVVKVSIKTVR